jgi:hypothetical protein
VDIPSRLTEPTESTGLRQEDMFTQECRDNMEAWTAKLSPTSTGAKPIARRAEPAFDTSFQRSHGNLSKGIRPHRVLPHA